jgi:hypothetical protein
MDFVRRPQSYFTSHVDRQYSPLTGMDWSEWEIILEELTRMGYIVKKESESDGGE